MGTPTLCRRRPQIEQEDLPILILHETRFGATRAIAEEIGTGARHLATVEVRAIKDLDPRSARFARIEGPTSSVASRRIVRLVRGRAVMVGSPPMSSSGPSTTD
jgi:hypothetical protein